MYFYFIDLKTEHAVCVSKTHFKNWFLLSDQPVVGLFQWSFVKLNFIKAI